MNTNICNANKDSNGSNNRNDVNASTTSDASNASNDSNANNDSNVNMERLTAGDYDEALALLNLAFHGSDSTKPSFEVSLPKMWKRDDEHMGKHIAYRVDGQLKTIVGIYPLKTKIGAHEFTFCTVGNVATHPDSRGKGYMHELMTAAISELARMNADAARLGGLRQRYERYGFEPAGTKYTYTLTKRNIMSIQDAGLTAGKIKFVPIGLGDTGYLAKARELFARQVIAVERASPEEFYLSTKAWQMNPWAALDENGEMMGYLVASDNKASLAEQLSYSYGSDGRLIDMIFAWVMQNDLDSLKLELAPWDRQSCRALGRLCENMSVSVASSFLVRSWAEITNALIELKAQQDKMPEGCLVLGIEGYGNIMMKVQDGAGSCCRTDQKAVLTLTPLDATRLLFGHMPPWTVEDLSHTATLPSAPAAMLLNSWLPLPLSWNGQDRV